MPSYRDLRPKGAKKCVCISVQSLNLLNIAQTRLDISHSLTMQIYNSILRVFSLRNQYREHMKLFLRGRVGLQHDFANRNAWWWRGAPISGLHGHECQQAQKRAQLARTAWLREVFPSAIPLYPSMVRPKRAARVTTRQMWTCQRAGRRGLTGQSRNGGPGSATLTFLHTKNISAFIEIPVLWISLFSEHFSHTRFFYSFFHFAISPLCTRAWHTSGLESLIAPWWRWDPYEYSHFLSCWLSFLLLQPLPLITPLYALLGQVARRVRLRRYVYYRKFALDVCLSSANRNMIKVCHIGQECVQCGWCPSDGKCYVRPLDCTSWVPWNRTDLCPSNTRTS